MSALSDLLTRENKHGVSARAIARAAREAGYTLNHDTAARYLRGDHGRPDEQTLRALSKVLTIPLAKLRAAALLPTEETQPYQPPDESSRLNRRQRRAVDEIIRAMLEPVPAQPPSELDLRRQGRAPSQRGKPAKTRQQAARRGKAEPPSS